MYLNKHILYWITRYPKTMDLSLEDLMEALRYKLPQMDLEGTTFRGGFEIFIPIENATYTNDDGLLRQHYFIITADSIKNAIRLYIYKEEKLNADFAQIRISFCIIIHALKEYVKEHRTVDQLLSKLIS
jgi:hypothetical protein